MEYNKDVSVPSVLVYLGLSKIPELGDSEEELLSALSHGEWSVRVAALRKLEGMVEHVAVEPLVAALADEQKAVRAAAARTLGMCGVRAPIAPLVNACHDGEWHVRAMALEALGKLGMRAPVEEVVTGLDDEDDAVRSMAVWALGELGTRAPIARLEQALDDPSWSVREATVLALAKLGAQVPNPVETMLGAARDEDEIVQVAWMEAASLLVTNEHIQNTSPASTSGDHVHGLIAHQTTSATGRGYIHGANPGMMKFDDQDREWQPAGPRHPSPGQIPQGDPIHRGDGRINSPSPLVGVPIMKDTHRRDRDDRHKDRKAVHIVPATVGKSAKRRRPSRLMRIIEGGLAAAVVLGIGLAWLLLSHQLRPATGNQGSMSLIYDNGGVAVQQLAWSSSKEQEALVAFADVSGNVQVWDVVARQHVANYHSPSPKVLALVWAGDGSLFIASLSSDGRTVQLNRAGTGFVKEIQDIPGLVLTAAWSPDGKRIAIAVASGKSSMVQVRDATTGVITAMHAAPTGAVHVIAWSLDSKLIATASDGRSGTAIDMWNSSTGESIIPPRPLPYTEASFRVLAMAWSPDGERLAYILSDGEVRVGNRASSSDLQMASNQGWPDEKQAGVARPWVAALAWSPDGKQLASTTDNGSVLIWDATSRDLQSTYKGRGKPLAALAWSPKGTSLVFSSVDGQMLVWQLS